ncbi:MAG: hypothetical protein ACP5JG_14660 [Anaerolineae bacterium]
MSNRDDTSSGSPFLRALGTILKVLFRLALVLVVGVLVGVGIYYAVSWVYPNVVVPVQENTRDIDDLEQSQNAIAQRLDQHIENVYGRLADLEGEVVRVQESAAVQERDTTEALDRLATVEPQLVALQATADAQDTTIAALERDLAAAEGDLEDQADALDDEQDRVSELAAELGTSIEAIEGQLEEVSAEQPILLGRLAMAQTAQDLLRVRVLLLEDNPGAARDTLLLAIQHLRQGAQLSPEVAEAADDLEARMRALDGLIESRSFTTAPALESLWAEVMSLVLPPPEGEAMMAEIEATTPLTATVAPTVTVTVTGTITPLPSPTPTFTPTPLATPTIPPTPTVTPTPSETITPTATLSP